MTKQIVNLGVANKGNGDPIRTAFDKVNQNFTELYNAIGLGDGNLNIGAFEFSGSTMTTTDSSDIIIAQQTQITSSLTVSGDVLPSVANGGNLGSLAKPWNSLYVSNSTIYLGGTPLSVDNSGNILINGNVYGGGGDRLVNGAKEVVLDANGTLNTPLLLPVTFTAVLDSEHMFFPSPAVALTGTPWQFEVQFQVGQDGTVQTMMDSPFPNPVNPGYVSGYTFIFTEADHGIPGYTFSLSLNDVVLAGGAGWTANPAVSPPPVYPSTVASAGAIKLTASESTWIFGTDGALTLPDVLKVSNTLNGSIVGENGLSITSKNGNQLSLGYNRATILNPIPGYNANVAVLFLDGSGATIEVNSDTTGNIWHFKTDGTIEYPGGIKQGYQDSTSCNSGVDTVIYTATTQWQHAIKLFVMVEGTPTGGTSWETQACDVIAVKGYVNDVIHVTAYGVTYSSATALATFDGQWNATTSRIEITCRPTSLTNSVVASVHAIEMTSND